MELALVLTARCNAACLHCSTSCGPRRTEALTTAEIVRLMEDAAAESPSPVFHVTGGEPFLDFEKLLTIVTRGSRLGATVTCTTNAYWATSSDAAAEKLARLKAGGLHVLGVSVSRFHQRFVPLRRVRLALQLARQAGLETLLKGAVTRADLGAGGALEEWKGLLSADRVHIFPVLPYLREGAALPDDEYYREAGLPEDRCPGAMVCIESDGMASSCCSPGGPAEFLSLGDARKVPLAELQSRLERLAKQRLLREQGPVHFARAAIEAGLGDRLRQSYAGPCDLCLHIAHDPELRAVAEQVSAKLDLAVLQQAFGLNLPDSQSGSITPVP